MDYIYEIGNTSEIIIMGRRNIISVTGFINWNNGKSSFAFNIRTDSKKLIKQDVLSCEGVQSMYHLELQGVEYALRYATEDIIIVKSTQSAIISGINTSLDNWAENNWCGKDGAQIKHIEFWKIIHGVRQKHQVIALEIEDQEKKNLQAAAKAYLPYHFHQKY
jgi:ribonuclease HI